MVKKVLIGSHHPGGINSLIPVIQRLQKHDSIDVYVLESEYTADKLRSKGINGHAVIEGRVEYDYLNQTLTALQPDLVLTGLVSQTKEDRVILDQLLVQVAKEQGVASLGILDTHYSYASRVSDFGTRNLKYTPSTLAVLDDLAVEGAVREGLSGDILIATGNPFFDSLPTLKGEFDADPSKKRQVRTELGLSQDAYVIMYGEQPIQADLGNKYGFDEFDALEDLLKGIQGQEHSENIQVLIKLHPRPKGNEIKYNELLAQYSDITTVINKKYDTQHAMLASDLVVSPFSTVLIEAVHLGIPRISLQPGLVGSDPLVTNNLGVTYAVKESGKIGEVIAQVRQNPTYLDQFCPNLANFKTDGKATDRVVGLVYDILGLESSY